MKFSVLLVALSVGAPVCSANLITNGDFETNLTPNFAVLAAMTRLRFRLESDRHGLQHKLPSGSQQQHLHRAQQYRHDHFSGTERKSEHRYHWRRQYCRWRQSSRRLPLPSGPNTH